MPTNLKSTFKLHRMWLRPSIMRRRVGPTRYQWKRNRWEGVCCKNFATLEPYACKDPSLDEARRSPDLQIPQQCQQTKATVHLLSASTCTPFIPLHLCVFVPSSGGYYSGPPPGFVWSSARLRQDLMTFIIRWGVGGEGCRGRGRARGLIWAAPLSVMTCTDTVPCRRK